MSTAAAFVQRTPAMKTIVREGAVDALEIGRAHV